MSSVYILKREISPDKKTGARRFRWAVRWEEGRGRCVYLGTYPTEALAKRRQRSVREMLADGEIPTLRITSTAQYRKFSELAAAWLETRIDVADNTRANFESSLTHLNAEWGRHDPGSISVADVQTWIGKQKGKPASIRLRLGHLSQILIFGDIEPNPVRSPKLRKPRKVREQYWLPNRPELAAMYGHLTEKHVGITLMMEHAGLRISEAVGLQWGDILPNRGYILVRGTKTHAGERKIQQVNGLPIFPVRPDGASLEARVFPNVTSRSAPAALRRASILAGVQNINPHRLRHLCASRLMHDAHLDPASIAQRMGHSTPQETLRVYTHMIPPDD